MTKIALLALASVALTGATSADDGRPALFDGRTLDGWHACNGSAPYTVENGAIVARTVVRSQDCEANATRPRKPRSAAHDSLQAAKKAGRARRDAAKDEPVRREAVDRSPRTR